MGTCTSSDVAQHTIMPAADNPNRKKHRGMLQYLTESNKILIEAMIRTKRVRKDEAQALSLMVLNYLVDAYPIIVSGAGSEEVNGVYWGLTQDNFCRLGENKFELFNIFYEGDHWWMSMESKLNPDAEIDYYWSNSILTVNEKNCKVPKAWHVKLGQEPTPWAMGCEETLNLIRESKKLSEGYSNYEIRSPVDGLLDLRALKSSKGVRHWDFTHEDYPSDESYQSTDKEDESDAEQTSIGSRHNRLQKLKPGSSVDAFRSYGMFPNARGARSKEIVKWLVNRLEERSMLFDELVYDMETEERDPDIGISI